MESAKAFLIRKLKVLMAKHGMEDKKNKTGWKIEVICGKAGNMSRANVTKILTKDKDFLTDTYDRLLHGFLPDVSFEAFVSGASTCEMARDHPELYAALEVAIQNAKVTGSLETVRSHMDWLRDNTTSSRAKLEQLRASQPEPQIVNPPKAPTAQDKGNTAANEKKKPKDRRKG